MNLPEMTAILARTPGTLRSLLDGLSEPWLVANEGDGTFSPRDVVGHLIHADDTDWMPRVHHLLAHGDTQPFPPFDRFGYKGASTQPIADMLSEFDRARARSLNALAHLGLTPAQLMLPGQHPQFGHVTLGQLLATWTVHDLNHIGQIVRVMSNRYATEVGPWKAYLGILNR